MLTDNVDSSIKEQAKAKLTRLRNSPHYHSFLNDLAIDAFSKVESSVFAGESIKADLQDDAAPPP